MNKHNRGFTILWFSLLLVILFQIFLLLRSEKAPVINNYIAKKGEAGQSIIGPQGPSGAQGLSGLQGVVGPAGTPGKDGVTTVINNTTNIPVSGPQGEKGAQGVPGKSGKQLQIMVDPETCQLQSKYVTDDFWQVIAQLPKPCEAE